MFQKHKIDISLIVSIKFFLSFQQVEFFKWSKPTMFTTQANVFPAHGVNYIFFYPTGVCV